MSSVQLPTPPPSDAYAVRGDDGQFYGWAQTLEQAVSVAAAVSMRSMMDLDVVDPDGNVQAHIGLFTPPSEATQQPIYVNAAADADDPLLVHLATSEPGIVVDHGDGTAQTLHETTEGTHRYENAGSYQILARRDERQAEAWINLEAAPTIPEEGA